MVYSCISSISIGLLLVNISQGHKNAGCGSHEARYGARETQAGSAGVLVLKNWIFSTFSKLLLVVPGLFTLGDGCQWGAETNIVWIHCSGMGKRRENKVEDLAVY